MVVLLLGELAVRVAAPHNRGLRMLLRASTTTTEFDDAETLPELMNRTMLGFRPGTVQYGFVLNSRSFRTHEYTTTPPPGVLRVVALGDSFTFASGALPDADHWTTLLERELEQRLDRRTEVLRLGVPDTGPAFQLRLWQIEASRLEPEVVVLAFFVGNDFTDHQADAGVFASRGRGLSGRLASLSALYRAVRNLTRVLAAGADRPSDAASRGAADVTPGEPVPGYRDTFDRDRPTFSRRRFLAIEAERMALCLRSEQAAFDRLAERVAGVVVELSSEVRASGADCVVMIIPDQYQIDGSLAERAAASVGHRIDDYDLERPQRALHQALDTAGVGRLDLLPVFRRHAGEGALYRPRDSHWNRRGNELAARALAQWVVRDRAATTADAIYSDGFEQGSSTAWSSTESTR